ncbi:hypothetical protein AB0D04_28965 [Streptomyces sp. NPDC048483]|uniref:hypothetical protein n=1 Tax=Streptomyces sp. NPDC048483 TaxID=3154927 RepID=UPI0034415405
MTAEVQSGTGRDQSWLRRSAAAALWLSLAAGALSVARWILPPSHDYTAHLVPKAAPLVAAVCGLAVAVLVLTAQVRPERARTVRVGTGAAIVLGVWGASGLPLDGLRVIGLIPLSIDWLGFVTRLAALGAAVALAATGTLYGRVAQEACLRCGRTGPSQSTRPSPKWCGYAAFLAALPYPLIKAYWAAGGTAGTGDGKLIKGFADGWGTVILAALGVLLALALVQEWGRRLPHRLLLLAGAGGALLLVTVGLPGSYAALQLIADHGVHAVDGDTKAWVFAVVYGCWLVMAVGMAAAVWAFWQRHRKACPACSLV